MTNHEFTQRLQGELRKKLQKEEIVQIEEQVVKNVIRKPCLLVRKRGREDIWIRDIEKYYHSLLAGDTS